MWEIGMTEVLFTASVAFVGYVIYVLVEEQISLAENHMVDVHPATPEIVESHIPQPASPRAKIAKAPTQRKKAAKIIVNLPESVGMAAGSIWRYLNENGPTAVAKLVETLSEDNKTLQRSIGWLAQEDKITLETSGRLEVIALKD
jgi:hypothetical protein